MSVCSVHMYSLIPGILQVGRDRLLDDSTLQERTLLTIDLIMGGLDCCLNTTYFVYRENYYKQKYGAAVGPAPCVADSRQFVHLYFEGV